MENLNPGELALIGVGILLAVAGFVNTIGAAVEKFAKVWRAAKAPNEAQDSRLDALEGWRKEMDAKKIQSRLDALEGWRTETQETLHKDKRELKEIHDGLRVSHLAQLALLDHALNGNNMKEMQDAKDALQKYLANK